MLLPEETGDRGVCLSGTKRVKYSMLAEPWM
jgi:hypothetical protein